MSKIKVIKGRSVTGRELKARLRNKTLEGQTFGADAYTLDEEMTKFMRMSRVEQIEAIKKNNANIRKMQSDLDNENNEKKRKQQQNAIDRAVENRLKEMAKQQPQQKSNTNE